MWDLDMIEEEEAVIHCIVAKLGTNIANVHPLQWLVSLHISNLTYEWVGTVRFSIDDQLCHNDSVVGR